MTNALGPAHASVDGTVRLAGTVEEPAQGEPQLTPPPSPPAAAGAG